MEDTLSGDGNDDGGALKHYYNNYCLQAYFNLQNLIPRLSLLPLTP